MALISDTETTDQVIQEVRKIKEALAKSLDFDIDRILEDARRKQQESGRKVISAIVRQMPDH
jgi:hypothetical protein